MNYENIFNLQQSGGLSFEEAQRVDALGIECGSEEFNEYMEKQEAIAERIEDLESRGFYNGTDNQYLDAQIERGQIEDDRIQMFLNEY